MSYVRCHQLQVEAKRIEREKIDAKVREFIEAGGTVETLRMGASSKDDALTMRVVRRPQLVRKGAKR